MFSRALNLYLFSRFIVSYLQYVDDNLILVAASIENLWFYKAILWGFKLSSGLLGVNVNPEFLDLVGEFLHCMLDNLLFSYPSLLMCTNTRFKSSLQPMITIISRKLVN